MQMGKMQHPSDSFSWKLVDRLWLEFATEDRNLRLEIVADGINHTVCRVVSIVVGL